MPRIEARFRLPVALGVLVLLLGPGNGWADERKAKVDFALTVQPLFAAHCYECHGPKRQESNFRLDLREIAMGDGDLGVPIVPGKASASPLFRYVSGDDPDLVMPPEDHQRLSIRQVALLRDWIDDGAPWPDALAGNPETRGETDHWSFQPVVNHQPPQITDRRIRNSIDAFVHLRREQGGLTASAPADRVTLIRRLLLDMHGLPPHPDRVAKFVANTSDTAYEDLVDEVLASHHYGERWARHWLDVVRFGESTGYEVNRDRENAYPFRDYVIDALNMDKSYRDFVMEQLAGDELGVDVGTGFLVGGPNDIVKSPDINLTLMQRQDELSDYVNTTSTAFLAMTVGCARCHNHKFDPILQKDYYAMQAVFAGVQHGERELTDENTKTVRAQIARFESERSKVLEQVTLLRDEAKAAVAAREAEDSTAKAKIEAVQFAHNIERFPTVEAVSIRFSIQATTSGEPCLDELEVFSPDERNVALAAAGAVATASGTLPGYDIHQLEHINDGKFGNPHSWISSTAGGGWIQIDFAQPAMIHRIEWGRDRTGVVKDRLATQYAIEWASPAGQWNSLVTSDHRKPFRSRNLDGDAFIVELPESRASVARTVWERLVKLTTRIEQLQTSIPKAYIGTFKTPETIHRLFRGDPQSPREIVEPDALSVIGSLGLTNDTPESKRRLALARWIASEDNPLTARVIVNRVWHYHFGTGLVATPSDFGVNGTRPSHPELLDWLAASFMQQGWSLKWLHREILTSATYRQSSRPRSDALARDADSRLLWRFPPRRLEAEAIRDCVLAVSGALNPATGGPGFLLFEINHENVHHYFPKKELGPAEFRRMIYMTKIRQEQDAVFGVFDCPDGGQVIPDRSRSTTPLQALNLLNSRFVMHQAETLAERVNREAGEVVADQVTRVFELAFSRSPDIDELSWATDLVDSHGLVALCRAIFNANEFLFLQ